MAPGSPLRARRPMSDCSAHRRPSWRSRRPRPPRSTCPMIHGSRRWETRRLREAARPGPWRTIATGIRRRRTTTGSMPGPTRSIRYPPHGATTACPEGMMEVPGWATWPMCCATGGRRPWRPCRMIRLTVGPGARKMRSERRLSIERMKHVISRMREIARSSD